MHHTSTARPRRNRRTGRRAGLAGLALVMAVGLAACTPEEREEIAGDLQSAVDDLESRAPDDATELTEAQTEAPATEAPATEAPATEAPTTEEATPEESEAPADEGEPIDWTPWIIAALVLLAILLLIGWMNKRRRERRWAHARVAEDLGDLIGTGRWVLDQGVTEALRLTDPTQLDRSWQSTRQQMIGLEEDMSRMLVDAEGDPLANALRASAEASAGLRSAMDADVARRSDPTSADDAALVQSMRDTVQERRTRFRETLDRLATFR